MSQIGRYATQINASAQNQTAQQITIAGVGNAVPLVYGRVSIGGRIIALGKIGTDLVVAYAWCLGEIDAIENVYINDAAPPAGVTLTHYTGTTTQGIDPTLSSALAGYTDTMVLTRPKGNVGVAYTVARITTAAALTGFPRARAILRGRKMLDPRYPLVAAAYSQNPALAINDILTDPVIGAGATVIGITDCANRCDAIAEGTEPRCFIGLAIDKSMTAMAAVNQLADYAEAIVDWQGTLARFVPDALVAAVVGTITGSDILEETLQLGVSGLENAPTQVEVSYTLTNAYTTPWTSDVQRSYLPGVDTGAIPAIPSTVSMPGITRASEALRKAKQRLARAQIGGTASWNMFDGGLALQKGDVWRLYVSARNVDCWVRITGVKQTAPGRYAITAAQYDPSQYPTDGTGPPTGSVPIGLIVFKRSGATPSGWADYTAANGAFIIGAGNTYGVGASGGSSTISISGITDAQGAHSGIGAPHQGNAITGYLLNATREGAEGTHTHTYTGSAPSLPAYASYPLIIKTGTAGTALPYNSAVLASAQIVNGLYAPITSIINAIISAGTVQASGGSYTQSAALTYSTQPAHDHFSNNTWSDAIDFENWSYGGGSAGAHSHSASSPVPVSLSPKRRRLMLYSSASDYAIAPGVIALWSGSIGALPTNWVLCDGTNGTPDCRDYFIELSDLTGLASASGTNTVSWSGVTSSESHMHTDTGVGTYNKVNDYTLHSDTQYHQHNVSGSQAWMPPYYALAAIMYVGP